MKSTTVIGDDQWKDDRLFLLNDAVKKAIVNFSNVTKHINQTIKNELENLRDTVIGTVNLSYLNVFLNFFVQSEIQFTV